MYVCMYPELGTCIFYICTSCEWMTAAYMTIMCDPTIFRHGGFLGEWCVCMWYLSHIMIRAPSLRRDSESWMHSFVWMISVGFGARNICIHVYVLTGNKLKGAIPRRAITELTPMAFGFLPFLFLKRLKDGRALCWGNSFCLSDLGEPDWIQSLTKRLKLWLRS